MISNSWKIECSRLLQNIPITNVIFLFFFLYLCVFCLICSLICCRRTEKNNTIDRLEFIYFLVTFKLIAGAQGVYFKPIKRQSTRVLNSFCVSHRSLNEGHLNQSHRNSVDIYFVFGICCPKLKFVCFLYSRSSISMQWT